MADDYAPSTARTYYAPSSSNQLARIWSVDKWVQDAVAAGFLEVFEGAGSDPTALSGYSTSKLWMRVPATGVASAAAEVRKWNGQSPASSLSNWPLASNLLTPIIINGDSGWPQTTAEIAAGVTPTNTAYPPGDVRRYGADATGAADSSTAWTNACKTGHMVLGGGAFEYRFTSAVTLTTACEIDLQGATLKPSGNTKLFTRATVSATASSTVSSGATKGSRSVVVSSATGFAVGQHCKLTANDAPANDANAYPPGWSIITAIVGTTITFADILPVTYAGTITFYGYATSSMLGRFAIRNGTIDGTLSTSATAAGDAVGVNAYYDAIIESVRFTNWINDSGSTTPVYVFNCRNVRVAGNTFLHQDNAGAVAECSDIGALLYEGNTVDGDSFGLTALRVDDPRWIGNTIKGRKSRDLDEATGPNSTRAMKAYGCYNPQFVGNRISDYESAFKLQSCFGGSIIGNEVRGRPDATGYAGEQCINVGGSGSSPTIGTHVIIANNRIDGYFGIAIGVNDAPAGHCIITGNVVRNVGGMAIFVVTENPIITENQVENWGLRNSGDAGIYHGAYGATITGNRFYHSSLTGLNCIRNFYSASYQWNVSGNIVESANPCVQFESEVALTAGATTALGTTPAGTIEINGSSTTITSFGASARGRRTLRFSTAQTIQYGAGTIITPTGSDLSVGVGDVLVVNNETGSGARWRVLDHVRATRLETEWFPATLMTARTTNGAASGTAELATNDIMLRTLDFDQTTEEGVGFWWSPPKSWDRGTVTFAAHWTAASGTGGVAWGLAAYAFSDDDAIDTAVSGQQIVTDTLIATNDMHVTTTSAAITIGGTPAVGDAIYFELTREVGNAADTLNADALLIGIRLFYTTNATTDA